MPARDNKGKILTGELLEGRYRIERPLGEGGQGAVYEASHVRLSGKRVAIKEMFGNDAVFIRAFEREAALLANLDHPALPDVSDYFQEDGSCFLVMDFVEGKNLWELMGITDDTGKGTPLDIESVLRWADDLLDALDYMHTQQQPVIHKDIKAQNIAVTSRNKVMLLDFGLATGAVGEITAMKSTLLRGYSPFYAPPEQILRSRFGHWYEVAKAMLPHDEVERIAAQGTDARSDLYSLAATLYHCLTGEPPAISTIRLMAASQGRPDPLKPASDINSRVSRVIDSFLMQAMRLNRDDRFASAKAMRKALVEASSPSPVPPPPPVDVFEFETVTLNAKGEVTNRRTGQARQVVEDLGGGVKIELVEIPAGEFLMGSPDTEANRSSDESPQHQVSVSSFHMGKYQVTQAQWRAVAALSKVKIDLNPDPSHFKGDDLPVESVSWEEAVEFCERLSKATGKEYRLPREAEWEYACRAGTTTPFAFGETITADWVNYDGNYPYASAPKGTYRGKTTPVGSLGVANGFGLYDMHGNVWEWCGDWYSENYYRESARVDPVGPDRGSYRVTRGGSWNFFARICRSAFRYWLTPTIRVSNLGFRLVRTLR
jgi:formylglycine-generating enzyme required for sulfatase activity/predicted Ser/Thr protein kinase